MNEKPILFSGAMVRAILDGSKTQTRRVIKFPKHVDPSEIKSMHQDGGGNWIAWCVDDPDLATFTKKAYPDGREGFVCPYGKPGDRLWVRETWARDVPGCPNGITYRADHVDQRHGDGPADLSSAWRSSIHMPRWASRILLEVTNVRAERLQDISERDAHAEGLGMAPTLPHPRAWFRDLWDSINAKRGYGWHSDPWVWVVEFRLIK